MIQEKNGSARTGLLIAAAATALTVAAGLTAGALLGYVGPGRSGAASSPQGEVVATETAADSLARTGERTLAAAAPEPASEEIPAAAEQVVAGEREGGGERGEREHERGEHERGEHERGEHEREHGDDDDD